MAYREPGEGWEVAYWPPEPPDAGVNLDALGRRAAAPDAALLAELQAQVDLGPERPLDPAATLVRRRPLPFYDRPDRRHVLHEIFRLGAAGTERARVLRVVGGDGQTVIWMSLAWTSAPIHDLNAAAEGRLLDAADMAAVVAYVDFFTGSIEGDDGTFQVVRFDDAVQAGGDEPAHSSVGADVLYGGSLFHCTFLVRPDGGIEMADDLPFEEDAGLPLPPAYRWLESTRRIQPTIRLEAAVTAREFQRCMESDEPEKELLAELERVIGMPEKFAMWKSERRPLKVLGNVDVPAGTEFRHDWKLGPLFLRRPIHLDGVLGLARCHLRQGLSLSLWTVRGGCRLEHAEVHGDLALDDVEIGAPATGMRAPGEASGPPPLDVRSVEVGGDFRLMDTQVHGDVNMRYAKVRGATQLIGVAIEGELDAVGAEMTMLSSAPGTGGMVTRIGRDLVLSGARIHGHVQLEPIHLGGDLTVVTPLDVGALYVRSATDARGRATADSSPGSTIGGAVGLANFGAKGRIEIDLAACGAGVGFRNVSCGALTVRGAVGPALDLSGVKVGGDALLQDLAVDGAAEGGTSLDLRHARIGGDLCVGRAHSHAAAVPGGVALSGAEVQGQIALRSLRIGGDLDLSGLVAKRRIELDGVEVDADLVMRHLSCQGDASLVGVTVRGDVELHHAAVNGTLGLCGEDGKPRADIGGRLLANALAAGKLVMTGNSWLRAGAAPAAGTGGTGFLAVPTLVGLLLLGLPLAALVVASSLLAGRALFDAVSAIEYEGDWTALWTGLKWLFWTGVGGVALFRVLRMWSMLCDLRAAPAARSMLTAEEDGRDGGRLHAELLRLWGAALVRALLLVALAATVFATRVWPGLVAADGVAGLPEPPALPWMALLLAIAWAALLDVRVCGATGYWLGQLARPAAPGPAGTGVMATLFALDVAAIVFAIAWLALGAGLPGHVRTGLALAVTVLLAVLVRLCSRRPVDSTLRMGFLDAASDGSGSSGANRLRLDAAQVALGFRDWLQVATMNRLRPADVPPQEPKCSLGRARIGHLRIVHPIPDWVDIGNLVVDRWDLPESGTRSYQYLNLLSHAAEFATESFTALERSLRNAGDREAAEQLHRSMRRETQWRERRWAQTASMLVLSLSGFGTKRARLIGVMTLWLLATAFWFAADYERSVGIGLAQQAEFMQVPDDECMPAAGALPDAGPAGPARASPAACPESARAKLFGAILAAPDAPLDRIGHGLAMALRYHVPILAWDIRPFIFPRGAGMWVYVSIVEAIHWILWPILIASLVPAILPRKDD